QRAFVRDEELSDRTKHCVVVHALLVFQIKRTSQAWPATADPAFAAPSSNLHVFKSAKVCSVELELQFAGVDGDPRWKPFDLQRRTLLRVNAVVALRRSGYGCSLRCLEIRRPVCLQVSQKMQQRPAHTAIAPQVLCARLRGRLGSVKLPYAQRSGVSQH